MNSAYSVNNRLIVESYKTDGGLRTTVKSGFAMIEQKNMLKGLKLLVDAHILIGNTKVMYVRAGSTVFVKEELLHTQPWAKKTLRAEGIEEEFMLLDAIYVEYVKEYFEYKDFDVKPGKAEQVEKEDTKKQEQT